MSRYEQLAELHKKLDELAKWKEEVKAGRVGGAGLVNILESLLVEIVVLKAQLRIKIRI